MSVKWDLAELINKAGYDMMTALEVADKEIKDFLASDETSKTVGIMQDRKCVDAVELRKKG